MTIPKTSPKFEELYRKLNPEQKEAVDTIEGPVMVVAGPGTGKTQVLILRIAKILQETDIEPENILALTFADAASYEMRKRLADMIGPLAWRVAIFTFHRFCNEIIQDYPEDFPEIIGSLNITETDQIRIAQEIISSSNLRYLKPFGDQFYYVKPLLKTISDLKREGIGAKEFSRASIHKHKQRGRYRVLERQIGKNKELALFYEKYQQALQERKYYDYDDMILKVVEKLSENEDFRISLQEQYHYILADEHQDANKAQNRVIELLGSYDKNPNIFIVGDEKQAIFRFQGASLENFLYVQRKYPKVKLIRLIRNYRSTQAILDAAGHLMAQEKNSLRAQGKSRSIKIKVYEFSHPDVELFFLGELIKKKIEQGTDSNQIAVLFRDNKDAIPVVWALRKKGIPFVLESDQDVLTDEYIKKLIVILRAIAHFGEDEILYQMLHIDFLGIEPLTIYKLGEIAVRVKMSLHEALRRSAYLREFETEDQQKLSEIYKKFSRWHTKSLNVSVGELFEQVVRESGLLADLLSREDSYERMEKLRRFFSEIRSLGTFHGKSTLADFVEHLRIIEEHGISLQKSAGTIARSGVRLMTAHKAKGREFTLVCIPHAVDRHWGNRRIVQHFALPEILGFFSENSRADEEERKLFYVALTRARREVHITYAKEGIEGRSQMPSRFVQELDPLLKEEKDVSSIEAEFMEHQDSMFRAVVQTKVSIQEKEFLKKLFYERGLSVTALNNYGECPWKYFYINLIRIPKAPTKHQLYGIAVHKCLEEFFKRYKIQEDVSKEYLLSRFEHHLSQVPFMPTDWREVLERGKHALSGYYDTYYPNWQRNVLTEFTIKDVFFEDAELEEPLRLTGKIDKLEFLSDGLGVNVVDYKTGQPKSRNEIEGKTKNARGDYWRQLVFYRLLMDKHKRGKYRMVSGELDFVEPNVRGKYKKEKFEVESKDVRELEELIRKVAREIANLTFWDTTCKNPSCEFCQLRSHMVRS